MDEKAKKIVLKKLRASVVFVGSGVDCAIRSGVEKSAAGAMKKRGRPKKTGPKNVSWTISAPPEIRERLNELAREMRVDRADVERACFRIGIEWLSRKGTE